MLKIESKDRISLKYLLESIVDGEIYDVDIDRWIGIHLMDDIRQEIKNALKEVLNVNSKM